MTNYTCQYKICSDCFLCDAKLQDSHLESILRSGQLSSGPVWRGQTWDSGGENNLNNPENRGQKIGDRKAWSVPYLHGGGGRGGKTLARGGPN